jgi:hypothetical protein
LSQETERIPVPTNGKGPHPVHEPAMPPDEQDDVVPTVTFTPTQLAVGFGVIASLILVLLGWMRRNRRRNRWPLG